MFPKEKIDKKVALVSGVGFSFAAIVIWEIFEFMADFFIAGSTNQGYSDSPDFDMLFFKIFGQGAGNVGQYPLFDTLFDMIAAVVGIVAAIIGFLVVSKILDKKKKHETTEKETAHV